MSRNLCVFLLLWTKTELCQNKLKFQKSDSDVITNKTFLIKRRYCEINYVITDLIGSLDFVRYGNIEYVLGA